MGEGGLPLWRIPGGRCPAWRRAVMFRNVLRPREEEQGAGLALSLPRALSTLHALVGPGELHGSC